jgi:lysophospholipase L1-like esterase
MKTLAYLLSLAVATAGLTGTQAGAATAMGQGRPSLKEGSARVVFVGDSITGLSRNHSAGFVRQIEWALEQVHPGCRPDLVPLGGSGQGIGSWKGVESSSRKNERELDVKGVPLKASLDKQADVLVVMLGMNDILSPYVGEDAASLDHWQAGYKELIEALRARTSPTTIALCSITPHTEDLLSPKNLARAKLNARVETLAGEFGGIYLPTGEGVGEILKRGRTLNPDFHVTYDFVHPNAAGHIAIAVAILRGLGEEAAAKKLEETRLAEVMEKAAGDLRPSLSWALSPSGQPDASGRQTFRVHCFCKAPGGGVRMVLSASGWEITPSSLQAEEGEFIVSGVPEHELNVLKLEGSDGTNSSSREVSIPAPWLLAAGFRQPFWVRGSDFDSEKAVTPLDKAIESGDAFLEVQPSETGKLDWQPYYASVNFTGLDAPGSIDFAAISYVPLFDTGYGARWVFSSHERAAELHLNTKAFAGNNWLTAWLNGKKLYAGMINAEPKRPKVVSVKLNQGWNALVFKSNHCAWLWQQTLDLKPSEPGDSFADIRYSIGPQHNTRSLDAKK